MTARYMTVSEAVEATGLTREVIYQLLNDQEHGPLPHIKVGRVYKIVRDQLATHIDRALGQGVSR